MNKYLLFSLILFFVFDIILLTKYIGLKDNNIELYRENNLLVEMINDIPYYVVKNVRYENHSIYINHEEIDSEIFQFKGVSYKLFYRIDFPFCENCIYPTLDRLSKFANEIGKDKIVIITSFPSKEFEEKFYSKVKKYDFNIINLLDVDFNVDPDELTGSYLFLMNRNMKTYKIFFVGKYNHYMLDDYFSYIKELLARECM